MEGSSTSTAVNKYNGIFKFVHGDEAKTLFLQARQLLASGEWTKCRAAFNDARTKSTMPEDVSTLSLIIDELERYMTYEIDAEIPIVENIDWLGVEQRRPELVEEGNDALPQGLFSLKVNLSEPDRVLHLVGRKNLSKLWLQDLIPEIFCSQVRADMILGVLSDWRVTESKVKVFYHPISSSEKLGVFKRVVARNAKDAELTFPFPLLKALSRKEFTSPEEGWDVDPTFDHTLSHGETHIREITVRVLRELGLTSHRLYDPACSTGVFLAALKKAFPSCTTIGQDLSRAMCDVAKQRVDQVHCGNAMQPKISPGSADVVFIRFLNSEVVTSEAAELLLDALLQTVAPGGVVITFGHTPVLLSAANFKMIDGFKLDSCTAVTNDKESILQYYVLRRK